MNLLGRSSKQMAKYGGWIGLIGLVLAIGGTFVNPEGSLKLLLQTLPPIFGLVSGYFLAKDLDTKFLLAVLVLFVAGSSVGSIAGVGDILAKVFKATALYFGAMMVYPILKYVWDLMTKNI